MRFVLLVVLFSLTVSVQAQDESNYFIEAEVSNLTPFIGQQVVYTFRVYSKVSRTQQGDIVDPDFEGFWQQDIGPVRRYTAFVDNESYEVTERRIALFPIYNGEIEIDSAALLIPRNPSREGEVLLTDPLTVNVRSLPSVSDPGHFDGVVGQFEMAPTVDRQQAQLGEPITLRLTVRGTGNIEQLPSPSLPESDIWRIFKNPSVYQAMESEGVLIGQKTYEWLLTAVEPGVHTLPEIALTYFDPSTQSYQSISTTAVVVDILPADEAVAATAFVFPTPESLALKPLPVALAVGRPETSVWLWLLWIVPPLVAFAAWWETRRRWQRARNANYYRRSEALKHALGIMSQAHRSSEPYRLIREALLAYFADKLGTTSRTLSYLDIEKAIHQKGIDPDASNAVVAYLEQIDRVLYAPGEVSPNPEIIQQVTQMLEFLDVRWKAL